MWRSAALLLSGISVLIHVSSGGPHQRKLLKSLLKDYNRMERPVGNDSNPLTVTFSLSLIQIMDVDEKNQVLTTNMWLRMSWFDHYLQWNQSEHPGVKNLRFTTDQIWTPDILLYNSADDDFDSTFKTNVLVNSSGFAEYLPPGIFMSTCNVDVRWFPFDIQKCVLKFGSWTYDGLLLDLQMNDADISGYMPNGEWDLIGVPGTRNEIFYDCCKEPYPDVTFNVTIRRRTLYYALNLLIPCMLLSSMTLLIFVLPADSGEKISLGITVLLSLTVFMLLVAEIMPATSDSVPLIGQYFASIMIIVGMSVIATVVVLQYHHHDPNGGNMPKWVKLVLLQWVAWFLRMKRPGEAEKPRRPPCAPHLRRCSSGSHSGSIPNHGDPGLHSLHPQNLHPLHQPHPHGPSGTTNNGNLLYFQGMEEPSLLPDAGQRCNNISTGPRSPPPHLPPHLCGSPPPPAPNLDGMGCPSTVSSGGGFGVGSGPCQVLSHGDPLLQAILEEVRYMADRFREHDEAESVADQWKFAGAVIDRLCLVAFSVFNIICTISILMSAPNFADAVSKDFV
ncbi:cholinergic receptor, nicotinic, alpha 11 isoform X1 [Corythoichthys intestinalis]|uniref:cholinergic receptor, nicotinic, alpha 11 isoform X1 n=1 Tax=Corythoichthys intestinalis TaxID=161448 RepID=UPI0025A57BF3|nr:cholinergic receptor, nicotinic, alpha 11 isoform X1 [Corythoichthys intestinalis]XP_061808517.1 neuronal acetylcholine receptor subunit alpha-7-like [Nerophis lumbriciformis]